MIGTVCRVVFSRLEFWWLRPHPPLRLLHPSVVWLPSGEDYYGGVNDRHAVLNRSAAQVTRTLTLTLTSCRRG